MMNCATRTIRGAPIVRHPLRINQIASKKKVCENDNGREEKSSEGESEMDDTIIRMTRRKRLTIAVYHDRVDDNSYRYDTDMVLQTNQASIRFEP